jgi:alkyldihydroxyacetonephosphate synthase
MSAYHIAAAAKLFHLDMTTAEDAFSTLRIRRWPCRKSRTVLLPLPSDDSELWTIVLQGSQWLEPVIRSTHPAWATWLSALQSARPVTANVAPEFSTLVKCIRAAFDTADDCVANALEVLTAKGFENPEASHVLQAALTCGSAAPTILLWASISFRLTSSRGSVVESAPLQECLVSPTDCILNSEERLGFWGFHDSSFYVKMGKDGIPCASMKGDRYGLCGKELKKLLPFIESEIQVKAKPTVKAFKSSDLMSLRAIPSALATEFVDMLKLATSKVSLLDFDRIRHGTGQNLADVYRIRSGQMMRVPDAVVWPSSDNELETLVALAKEHGWCLVPFGGGTNVSQATSCPSLQIEPRPIISLDMKDMDQVLWLNEENGLVHVQAGITGRTLVAEMERRGYTVGHEPDSLEFSTLGGWIATKASGMKRTKYGNIEDIVKAVTVVGATGLLQHGHTDASWGRESSGIDLPSLLLGSEGNLGIITSAVLRIYPLPEVRDYDSILLRNFDEGIQFTRQVSRFGSATPASCRLLDNAHFRLGKALQPSGNQSLTEIAQSSFLMACAWYRGSFHQREIVCITITYEGSKKEVDAQKRAIHQLVLALDGIHLGPRHGKAGYEMTFLIAYLRDFAMNYHYLGDSFETFAPWSKLSSIIQAAKDRIRHEHEKRLIPGKPFIGCRVTQLYHEGACLYFYFALSSENVPNACNVFAEIEHAARSEILKQGGSLSHHHGVGKVRAPFLSSINSPALQSTMLAIKKGMDPDNVFGIRNGPCCASATRTTMDVDEPAVINSLM